MVSKSNIQKPKGTDYISYGDNAITANAQVLEYVYDRAESASLGALAANGATQTADGFLLRPADDTVYAIPLVDHDGHVAAGVQRDGRFNFESPPTVGGTTATFQPISAPGYAFAFTDSQGNVAAGITTDGRFIAPAMDSQTASDSLSAANDWLGYTKTRTDAITTIGDSLTYGYFDGSPGPTSDSWPSVLAGLLGSSVTVTNLGRSGYTVDEEAIYVGAYPLPLTVSGGSIPASGSVTVSTTASIGWATPERTLTYTGTLANVPGTLSRAADGTLTFTRTATGNSTPVPAGEMFVSDKAGHDDEILTVLLGRNNISFGASGESSTMADHVVNGIRRIVDWQSRDMSKVLVLSVTNTQAETIGTAGHATVIEINDRLKDVYGPRFLDIRSPLVHDSLDALGISPTQEDLDAMAADAIPPSIMGDNTHWTKDGHEFVAGLINTWLTDRDWTKK